MSKSILRRKGCASFLCVLLVVTAGACADEAEDNRLTTGRPAPDTSESDTTTTIDTEPTETTTTTIRERDEFIVGDRVETSLGNFLQVFSYEQPVPPPDEFSAPEPELNMR